MRTGDLGVRAEVDVARVRDLAGVRGFGGEDLPVFAEADALLHETLGVSPFSEEDIEYFSGCAAPRSPSFP